MPPARDDPPGAGREIAVQRQEVLALIAVLDADLAGIDAAAAGANGDDEHDPEGATIAFERQHTVALLGQARRRLAALDGALARLDDGSYGRCQACGGPIGAGRLAARPAATTCIRCAAAGVDRPRHHRG